MIEPRFSYYLSYSIEELREAKARIEEELRSDMESVEDSTINSELKSELLNSDIPYERDSLAAVIKCIEIKEAELQNGEVQAEEPQGRGTR